MISEHSDQDAMAARLAIIDAEPLEDRASGYAELHAELRERLEGAVAGGPSTGGGSTHAGTAATVEARS